MEIAAGRRALVTGAASGLGLEVARHLAQAGVALALLDVDVDAVGQAASEIGSGALALGADVRDRSQVAGAVEHALSALGGLDTLVVAAGVIHTKRLAEVTEQDWDATLDINLKGAFLCAQAAAPALYASGRGRIVTISSDAGRRGAPLLQAYTASKFGLIGLTESLAAELAPAVTANCVCPIGIPTTAMGQRLLDWKAKRTDRSKQEVLADVARSIPMGRNATERDIAEAVMFFVSESASFLTGVSLDVDGGSSLDSIPGSAA